MKHYISTLQNAVLILQEAVSNLIDRVDKLEKRGVRRTDVKRT